MLPCLTINGVWPPWNHGFTFPCCFWPLWPRPDVFPWPDEGPRPTRFFMWIAPGLLARLPRIEACRVCWSVRPARHAVSEPTEVPVAPLQHKDVLGGSNLGGMTARLTLSQAIVYRLLIFLGELSDERWMARVPQNSASGRYQRPDLVSQSRFNLRLNTAVPRQRHLYTMLH